MAKMGQYCKAYRLKDLRGYSGWKEKAENARKEKKLVDGEETERTRTLEDDSIVYIQQDYTVTDGIYMDEYVVFDQVTPEWIAYCKEELGFILPFTDSDTK